MRSRILGFRRMSKAVPCFVLMLLGGTGLVACGGGVAGTYVAKETSPDGETMSMSLELKGGKKRTRKRKLYPGYVLVEVEEEQGKVPRDVWFLVRETAGVGDFVGPHGEPEPLDEKEVGKLLSAVEKSEERAPHLQIGMKKGDSVKIKEGPVEGYDGVVDEVDAKKGTVKVIITVFNRPTSVQLGYWQVELI